MPKSLTMPSFWMYVAFPSQKMRGDSIALVATP